MAWRSDNPSSDEDPVLFIKGPFNDTPSMVVPKFPVDKSRATVAADMCLKCHQRENTEPWGYCTECEEEILATDLSESS